MSMKRNNVKKQKIQETKNANNVKNTEITSIKTKTKRKTNEKMKTKTNEYIVRKKLLQEIVHKELTINVINMA